MKQQNHETLAWVTLVFHKLWERYFFFLEWNQIFFLWPQMFMIFRNIQKLDNLFSLAYFIFEDAWGVWLKSLSSTLHTVFAFPQAHTAAISKNIIPRIPDWRQV